MPNYQPCILVDLGGTVMLTDPLPSKYIFDKGLTRASSAEKEAAIVQALDAGQMVPKLLPGTKVGVEKLASRYSLSLFSDGPEEFTNFCRDYLPISQFFPSNLVIPRIVLDVRGKFERSSWRSARNFLREQEYNPVAFIDDEAEAFAAGLTAKLGMKAYLMVCDTAYPTKKSGYWMVGNLEQMADHLLGELK